MLNSRSTLTDAQGRFEFRDFSDAQGYINLTRPGYSQSNDMSFGGGGRPQRIADLDAPAELKIYPDALVSGMVTGRDGLPLTKVPVTLRRAIYDQTGLRWTSNRSVQTDLHGEYRFREPAGRFQVSVGFVARTLDTGDAVLPQSYPEANASGSESYFEVSAGQERRLDLRPRTGPEYSAAVQIDSSEAQRGVQFYAVTSGGDTFQVGASITRNGSIYQLSLPAGTYTLHGKLESREASLQGSTKLTVTSSSTDPVVMHLEPAVYLPVELAIDPASTQAPANPAQTPAQSNQGPDLRQFNLHLTNLDSAGPFTSQEIQIRQKEDKSYEFRVPPGRYRLNANGGGAWFIESASYGTMNLATSEVTIGSSGSGFPIRLVVNNLYGTISATVKAGGGTDTVWVYLIPDKPSLSTINPVGAGIGIPGTTTSISMRAPVGSYVVVALDHQIQSDMRNADVVNKFSTNAKHVEVATSSNATVALELATEKETAK